MNGEYVFLGKGRFGIGRMAGTKIGQTNWSPFEEEEEEKSWTSEFLAQIVKPSLFPLPLLEPFYKRWEKRRPISFDFAENVPENTRQKIGQALGIWQRETCLRFAEGGPEIDRLEFFDGGGCSSFVGRAGGTQV